MPSALEVGRRPTCDVVLGSVYAGMGGVAILFLRLHQTILQQQDQELATMINKTLQLQCTRVTDVPNAILDRVLAMAELAAERDRCAVSLDRGPVFLLQEGRNDSVVRSRRHICHSSDCLWIQG